jgi:membrane protein DedA with SNARE-associated domain
MADFINQLAVWIENLVAAVGYPGIFAIMFLENVFPPIPTDPLIPFAGILAAEGRLSLLGVWLAAISGALVGSMVLYVVGATLGESAVRSVVRRYGRYVSITEDQLDRSLALFSRYGGGFVFVGRAVPVLRSAVSLTAGMSRMPVPKFLLYAGAMSALVTGFWAVIGYTVGENWRDILSVINQYQSLLVVVVVVIAVAAVGVWYMRRNLRRQRMRTQPVSSSEDV